VCQELAAIEPFQGLLHLVSEPGIVIQVVLHKLLNVLIRATAVLGGYTVELGLQFRREE